MCTGLFAALCVLIGVHHCISADILDLIFGPRLQSMARRIDGKNGPVNDAIADLSNALYLSKWYESKLKYQKDILFIMMKSQRQLEFTAGGFMEVNVQTFASETLTQGYGYPFESHEVISQDGYILKLHRIPYGAKSKIMKQTRPVVLLHHGLFGSSDNWLFRGPDIDLTYVLADAGYDVWIVNSRGNTYSRKHVILNPDTDKSFWKFSFHELAIYDLPATIDYILKVTNRKDVFYIGYSMGASVGYILCSAKPEYNKKIRLIISLAPSAYAVHKFSPAFRLVLSILPALLETLKADNIREIFPRRQFTEDFLKTVCQNASPTQQICLVSIFIFVGVDYTQLNTTIIPQMFKYFPSGTSLETLVHYYQLFTTGLFRPIDYGRDVNRAIYNSDVPESYNLSKITAPVSIHYGDGDELVAKEDCELLATKLPNLVGLYKVPYPSFNHLDFMWGSDAKNLVYDPVILLMNKYR